MVINLPRYADDDAVDLVNGAYNQAMADLETTINSSWDNIGIAKTIANKALSTAEQAMTNANAASSTAQQAKTNADAASATAEQAKTSVLGQKNEIDKLRGDVDGLIAGGGEASVPIATTSKAGIVKPDGSTISVQVDGTVSLADNSVNSTKLTPGGVTEEKLSDGVKAKLNKPAVEPYTLPVAANTILGGIKTGGHIYTDTSGIAYIYNATADTIGGIKLGTLLSATEDGTVSLNNNSVTEAKLSTDVQAKLNKSTGLTEVPDNSVTSAKIVNGAVTETKLSTEVQTKLNKTAPAYSLPVATTTVLGGVKSGGDIIVSSTGTMTVDGSAVTTDKISDAAVTETKLSTDVQAKLNKSTGLTEVPDNSVTSAKIVNGAVTETKLSTEVQTKLNKTAPAYSLPVATTTVLGGVKSGGDINVGSTGTMTVGSGAVNTTKISDAAVTETKLSTDVQAKLNRSAPAYSLPVASTSRLGGVKAGRDINIDSAGFMTIGSGMIEESQLSSSVQNKLNKSGETISAQSISINTTSYAGSNCHAFKFGDLIILNIQARNLSGSSGIKIGNVIYAYTPRKEMSGPCVCGNGLGQFVIRTSGEIIINPKGYGPDGFFTCTYVL